MRGVEHNRLAAGVSAAAVSAWLEAHITYLDQEIARTKQQTKYHISHHPTLRSQRDLLITIPGIANTTAAALLCQILDITLYQGARQVTALAGLVPQAGRMHRF